MAGLAALLAGCGDSGNGGRIVRGPGTDANGDLIADPSPLTVDDVNSRGTGTPANTVLGLYFYVQWGALPSAIALYDPRLVDAFGTDTVIAALASVRTDLLRTRVEVGKAIRSRFGTVVTVTGVRRADTSTHNSFTLRRRDGRWYVVGDTLLEGALADVAAARAGGGAREQATAAQQIVARYRKIAIGSARPAPTPTATATATATP